MIYNPSLKTGVFPDIWKLANVIPYFQNRPKNDASNYRTGLLSFQECFEKISHDKKFQFLQPIFAKNQAACCKLYSTITFLINITDQGWHQESSDGRAGASDRGSEVANKCSFHT